jgi:dihydrofolate reductase
MTVGTVTVDRVLEEMGGMRELAVIEFVTLDGVMQGFGSPDEDRDGGFEYGGWGQPYGDAVLAQSAAEGLRNTTAYLFGRKTYEKMAAYWPHQPVDDPMAAHLNAAPKYVVTQTLTDLEWGGSEVLSGDVRESVDALKQEGDGTIAVLGSGVLVQSLIENEQVDKFRLFVHPLVLGAGKRLFRQTPRPLPMRLVDCKPTSTGVLLLTYVPE